MCFALDIRVCILYWGGEFRLVWWVLCVQQPLVNGIMAVAHCEADSSYEIHLLDGSQIQCIIIKGLNEISISYVRRWNGIDFFAI